MGDGGLTTGSDVTCVEGGGLTDGRFAVDVAADSMGAKRDKPLCTELEQKLVHANFVLVLLAGLDDLEQLTIGQTVSCTRHSS